MPSLTCEYCGNIAGMRKKFRDPRRDGDDYVAYTERYFCSEECEDLIAEWLERAAQTAHLVH